ncbi:hypothetical protein [Stenotrophomonas pigmentata]|uniref:hypothetical protein n=1 Tax=Stenotrophomonas pigmentata TaxID=3055080 RepID=UPI0026EE66D8|nr:hypothetical protein [Stenotrophomonas sp. 610A2]
MSSAPKKDRFGIPYNSPTWLEDSQKAYGEGVADFFKRRVARVAAKDLRERTEEADREADDLASRTQEAAAAPKVVRL